MISHLHTTQSPQNSRLQSSTRQILSRKHKTQLSISAKHAFINNYSKFHTEPYTKDNELQGLPWHSETANARIYIKQIFGFIKVTIDHLNVKLSFIKMLLCKDTREIIKHWEYDKKSLSRLFFDSEKIGKIRRIQRLSNTSNNCLSYGVNFISGQTIIYKTRSLELEQKFYHVAHLLGFFELYQPKVFSKNSYSWMSYRAAKKITTDQDIDHVNYNFGLFLSLACSLDSAQPNLSILFKKPTHSLFSDLIHSYCSKVLMLNEQPHQFALAQRERRIETVIDGFILGYRRISAINFSENKIKALSKLMPTDYLYQFTALAVNKTKQNQSINEMEYSNQIQQIRQFFDERNLLNH